MKKHFLKHAALGLLLTVGIFAGCAGPGTYSNIERKTVKGLPTVTTTEYTRADAKVEAVDYSNRSIALTGPDGKTQIFHVTPAVRNFSQIKKGDTVKVEYLTQIHASVRKVTEQPSTEITDAVALAELGQKPGIICTRKAIIQANVDSINLDTREVKLRSTNGDVLTLTADKKLKNLDKVHVGDQVVFDYTEAVSISVE